MKKLSNKLRKLRAILVQGICKCPKDCYACCTAIKFTVEEKSRMDKCLKKHGYKKPPLGKGKDFCEYLDKKGKCAVYEERPIICRALGVVNYAFLRCPHVTPVKTLEHPPELILYARNLNTIRNKCEAGNIEKGLMEGDEEVLASLARTVVQAKRDGSMTLEETGKWLIKIEKKLKEKGKTLEDIFKL